MGCDHEMQMEHAHKLANIEARAKSNSHRLSKLEDLTKTIHDLIAEVRELASNMRSMVDRTNELADKVDELEGKDGDKWREFIGHGIKVIIGIAVGAVVTKYIGLL